MSSTPPCSPNRGLRGRLFAVLGSSLALGDHLVAHPQSWKLLRGKVKLPSREQLRAAFTECVDETASAEPAGPDSVVSRLCTLYRDHLLVLAALDLAATVEDEPVLPFTVVGRPPVGHSPTPRWRPRCGWPRRPCAVTARHRGWRSSRWANAVPAN